MESKQVIAPKNPEPDKTTENKTIQPVVERLQKLIADYLAPAKAMGLKIKGEDILRVLDAAAEQAEAPETKAEFGQTPEDYFMDGLYEELIQQPGAILEKVTDAEGKEHYAPMSDAVWLACLNRLREIVRRGLG